MQIPEQSLVKAVIYAVQGIDSKYSRYSIKDEAFVVDPSIGVPRSQRHLISQLCELGWLYKKVQDHARAAVSADGESCSTCCCPGPSQPNLGLVHALTYPPFHTICILSS